MAKGRTTPDWSAERPKGQPQGNAVPQPPKEEKKIKTPHRKVYAGGFGGGTAGLVSVVVAYHFPAMPATVTAAYASLLVTVIGFLVSYLTKPEEV